MLIRDNHTQISHIARFEYEHVTEEWIDFIPANYLNATHPDAIFVQKLLIVQHSAEGRLILLGNVLKTITADGIEKQQLTGDDIAQVLKKRFALSVPQ